MKNKCSSLKESLNNTEKCAKKSHRKEREMTYLKLEKVKEAFEMNNEKVETKLLEF